MVQLPRHIIHTLHVNSSSLVSWFPCINDESSDDDHNHRLRLDPALVVPAGQEEEEESAQVSLETFQRTLNHWEP